MRRLLTATAITATVIGFGVIQLPASAEEGASAKKAESREVFSPDGSITKVLVDKAALPKPRVLAAVDADVITVQETGATEARFDLVFVGDGYTADEQELFGSQVRARWAQMTEIEPFKSLAGQFNVWQVNAVSNQSGSDHDPTRGVVKDTALSGGFWCGEMERLICVDTAAADRYAALAPAADQVLVLVNSQTYGGSGGTLAVSSGGNAQSAQIVVHELGHSIGGLGDEYGGPGTHPGAAEPDNPNSSLADAAEMAQQQLKWHDYLGRPTPDGGVIGTFEGSDYFDAGVYRPSEDSIMRTLGNEFNLVGLDVMRSAILARTDSALAGTNSGG